MKPRTVRPFYPVLFAAFPVLSLASTNIGEMYLSYLGFPLLATVLAALSVWAVLARTLDGWTAAAVPTALVWVGVLAYGHAGNLVPDFHFAVGTLVLEGGRLALRAWDVYGHPPHLIFVGDGSVSWHAVFLPLWLLLLGLSLWFLFRHRRRWPLWTLHLNAVGVLLVIQPALGLAWSTVRSGGAYPAAVAPDVGQWAKMGKPATPPGAAPNIYYIVLDRYARADVLDEFFHFDNSEFLLALRERGFHVAPESRANYPRTLSSLASTLNLDYVVHDLAAVGGAMGSGRRPLMKLIEDHAVGRFLKLRGYEHLHAGSWVFHDNRHADRVYGACRLSEFSAALIGTTVFGPLLGDAKFRGGCIPANRRRYWEREGGKFRWLERAVAGDAPAFVFAHFLLPHDPYVFDVDGDFVTPEEEHRRGRTQGYVDQVRFVNRRLLQTIDRILARSERESIIVIQADEGPFPEHLRDRLDGVDWSRASEAELRMKLGILNAYRLPGVDVGRLPPDVSPVNTFRIILKEFFGTELKLLPDRAYAYGKGGYYDLFEVPPSQTHVARLPAAAPSSGTDGAH